MRVPRARAIIFPMPELPVARERLRSLDVFRGLTVAGMLLVNDPGSWEAIYPPLEHAPWHGWTPTDLVFPFFLFIVGITTYLSLGARRAAGAATREVDLRIIRRGALIILFGLLLNAFPFYWWGKIAGNPDPTLWQRVVWRAQHLRYCGVLQRIGIVYIISALIAVRTTLRQQLLIVATLLLGYWIVMTLVPVPGTGTIGYFLLDDPARTLAAWSDRLILGSKHIWSSSKTYDPEGPLSTLPAIGTALLGVLAGRWISVREKPLVERVAGLFGAGAVAMTVGSFWSWFFPINKNLWTSSYVVFTAGFACVALATCIWLIDVHGVSRWSAPFVVFGVNPLTAFVGSGVMARLLGLIKIGPADARISLQQLTFQWLAQPWMSERFASLLWGLLFVAVWFAVLGVMYRRGIILKV
jgi:predicted acyltransferase